MATDSATLVEQMAHYPGFVTRGRTWEFVRQKFERLAAPHTTAVLRDRIAAAVAGLERLPVTELTGLLGAVRRVRQ